LPSSRFVSLSVEEEQLHSIRHCLQSFFTLAKKASPIPMSSFLVSAHFSILLAMRVSPPPSSFHVAHECFCSRTSVSIFHAILGVRVRVLTNLSTAMSKSQYYISTLQTRERVVSALDDIVHFCGDAIVPVCHLATPSFNVPTIVPSFSMSQAMSKVPTSSPLLLAPTSFPIHRDTTTRPSGNSLLLLGSWLSSPVRS